MNPHPMGSLTPAQQFQVTQFLSRLAVEMVHQGAAVLALRPRSHGGVVALERGDQVITSRELDPEGYSLLRQYLEKRSVDDGKGTSLIWIRAQDRLIEGRTSAGAASLRVEVQGVLTIETWLAEMGIELGARSVLRVMQTEQCRALLAAPSSQALLHLEALFTTLTTGTSVPLRSHRSALPEAARSVGFAVQARDPQSALVACQEAGRYEVQSVLFMDLAPRACRRCRVVANENGVKQWLTPGCTNCAQTGSDGLVPLLAARQLTEPLSVECEKEWGDSPFRNDLLYKASQGVITHAVLVSRGEAPPQASPSGGDCDKMPDRDEAPRGAILIVEDDPDQRSILQTYLTKSGYAVTAAEDGVRGLTALQTFDPDLIVTDLMMPNMDGAQFIAQVRRDSRFAATPILVLTVVDDDERELNALELGADDYCEKTMQRKLLMKRIEKLLARRL